MGIYIISIPRQGKFSRTYRVNGVDRIDIVMESYELESSCEKFGSDVGIRQRAHKSQHCESSAKFVFFVRTNTVSSKIRASVRKSCVKANIE